MDDIILTIEQYQDAIKNALSYRQVELLQILYAFPFSTATAKELAAVLSPQAPSIIVASGQIGKVGKAIAIYNGVTPWLYGKKQVPAYFSLIGPYYPHEGKLSNQRAGWEMKENLRIALQNLNLAGNDLTHIEITEKLPTEERFNQQELYLEGKTIQVFVNRFERNQKARLECIKHYGDNCFICGFNFGDFYGENAKGFIHVHHKIQLSKIQTEYVVNPINDLIPLCANCHCVVHLNNPALTVQELQKRIKKKG